MGNRTIERASARGIGTDSDNRVSAALNRVGGNVHTHSEQRRVCARVYMIHTLCFSALSMMERELFRELIRRLDRKINPGLSRLTWNTEYVDAYIEDCFNQTANVRFVLSSFSRCFSLCTLLPLSRPLSLCPTLAGGTARRRLYAVPKFMQRVRLCPREIKF